MPPIWTWHENSGGNGIEVPNTGWSDSGGLTILAPQSLQRLIFRYGASAADITVNSANTLAPEPLIAWLSLTLVDDSGTTTVFTDAQPIHQHALYLPEGGGTGATHAFYWEGPTFSFDAQVRRAAPAPPSDGLIVNWLIEAVPIYAGMQGPWHGHKYVQTYYWLRALTSEPGVDDGSRST